MYVLRTGTSAYWTTESRLSGSSEDIVIPTELLSSTLARQHSTAQHIGNRITCPSLWRCGSSAEHSSYLNTLLLCHSALYLFLLQTFPQPPAPLFFPSRSGNSTRLGQACLPNPRPRQPCHPLAISLFSNHQPACDFRIPRTLPVCCSTACSSVLFVGI